MGRGGGDRRKRRPREGDGGAQAGYARDVVFPLGVRTNAYDKYLSQHNIGQTVLPVVPTKSLGCPITSKTEQQFRRPKGSSLFILRTKKSPCQRLFCRNTSVEHLHLITSQQRAHSRALARFPFQDKTPSVAPRPRSTRAARPPLYGA